MRFNSYFSGHRHDDEDSDLLDEIEMPAWVAAMKEMDNATHQCKKCLNFYRAASSLRRHERECGKEKFLHCELCGYSCYRNYQLRNHFLHHH